MFFYCVMRKEKKLMLKSGAFLLASNGELWCQTHCYLVRSSQAVRSVFSALQTGGGWRPTSHTNAIADLNTEGVAGEEGRKVVEEVEEEHSLSLPGLH